MKLVMSLISLLDVLSSLVHDFHVDYNSPMISDIDFNEINIVYIPCMISDIDSNIYYNLIISDSSLPFVNFHYLHNISFTR